MEYEILDESKYEMLDSDDYETVETSGTKNQEIEILNNDDYEELNESEYEVADLEEEDFRLSDIPKTMAKGASGLYEGAGWLVEKAGEKTGIESVEDYGTAIRDTGKEAKDYWEEGISKSAKDITGKQLLVRDDVGDIDYTGTLGNIATSPDTVGMMILESLPATGLGMGVGGLITKGFSLVPQIGTKLSAALGYGSGEGGVAASLAGVGTEEKINKMSHRKLMEHPEYIAVYKKLKDKAKAKDIIARSASGDAAATTFLTTAVLSAPFGYVMSPIFNPLKGAGKDGLTRAGLIGGAEELVQETLQSGSEQIAQNKAIQDWADESQEIYEGVPEAMVAGGVSGFAMGGTLGAGQQAMDNRQPQTEEQIRVEEQNKKFAEAIGHLDEAMPDATQEEKEDIANHAVCPVSHRVHLTHH